MQPGTTIDAMEMMMTTTTMPRQYLHVLSYNINHAAVKDIDVRRRIVNAVLSSMASKGDMTRTACNRSRHCCIGGGTHLRPLEARWHVAVGHQTHHGTRAIGGGDGIACASTIGVRSQFLWPAGGEGWWRRLRWCGGSGGGPGRSSKEEVGRHRQRLQRGG
jgi:hypothetical protein